MTERAKKLLLLYYKQSRKIRRVSGLPPLTFKAKKAGTLKNYRIYGQTVDGESVGDRTGNLFDINSPLLYNASISKLNAEINTDLFPYGTGGSRRCIFIPVEPNTTYTFSCRTAGDKLVIATYNQRYTKAQLDLYTTDNCLISDGEIIFDIQKGYTLYTFTTPATTNMIGIYYQLNISPTGIMLNEGSTALPYEPYGYKVPVTVEGKNLCNNIWEQKMINAETGNTSPNENTVCCDFIPVKPNVTYSCSRTIANNYNNLRCYGTNKNYLGTGADLANKGNPLKQRELFGTFMITDARVSYIRFNDLSNSLDTKYMFVEGIYTAETMPPYEPYHAPTTTPIYLPEQICKVGDEVDYIDFLAQKMYKAGAETVDVVVPVLPTLPGTNTLTVGTEVQPSGVEIKGRIKAAGGD